MTSKFKMERKASIEIHNNLSPMDKGDDSVLLPPSRRRTNKSHLPDVHNTNGTKNSISRIEAESRTDFNKTFRKSGMSSVTSLNNFKTDKTDKTYNANDPNNNPFFI